MPEFNPERAAFWLVAATVGAIMALIMEYVTACIAWPSLACPQEGRVVDLVTAVLASAMAFAAGRISK
jgi:hypothetical protein